MAKTRPTTIVLKSPGVRDEGKASETISPGHLVEFGGANDYRKHSTAGGNALATFAVEDELQGNGIDTDYASGDNTLVETLHQGSEALAWLAAGENVAKGAYLESAGDGTLRAVGTGTTTEENAVIAMALEAKDLSASGATADRIKVRIA